jgi:hypothetical protein
MVSDGFFKIPTFSRRVYVMENSYEYFSKGSRGGYVAANRPGRTVNDIRDNPASHQNFSGIRIRVMERKTSE